jgi:hydrogenase maturation protease
MGDEGIGVRVVEALRERALPAEVEIFDGGTAFYALTGVLADFDRLVIVDAVEGGGVPGTVYRFGLGALEGCETAAMPALSLHDMSVIQALKLEQLVGRIPEEVVFVGVEPCRMEPSTELSPLLEEKLPTVVRAVLEQVTPPTSARGQ